MPQSQPQAKLFCLLPEPRPPLVKFGLSMGAQALGLVVLAWIGVVHPEVLLPPVHDYHFIQLVPTPHPVNHVPAPVRVLRPPKELAHLEEAKPALRLPPEQIKPKPAPAIAAPNVVVSASKTVVIQTDAPRIPRELVKTNVFSTGSSAVPTIARAPQQVQTGGFGDPNGVPARENKGKPVNIAQLGGYDLPTGPGYGNGTGGARGVRGVVASAGFGNGVATGDGTGRVNTTRGTVREGGFGDAEAALPTPSRPKADQVAPKMVPVEIVEKPLPVYTEEARKLHIEGEVLLQVVFESTGRLRILRVVQGLGHGLDEAAIRAAQQIQFKPALRDGSPADANAVLHIVFQIAS
jgi:TonB family protein